jgi:peptidoglycan biosynthesis protein MviN/MurJ (putative lipid II flippase)
MYGLTLVPGFVAGILLRALFAVGRPWSSVVTTSAITLAALGCDVALLGQLGLFAIPLGYAVGLTVSCVVGVLLLRRILHAGIGLLLLRELRAVPVAAVAAALLLLVGGPVLNFVHGLGLPGKGTEVAFVAAAGLLYGAVYLAIGAALRLPEVAVLHSWVRRRAPSPAP